MVLLSERPHGEDGKNGGMPPTVIPMLPCADIDEIAEFLTALGFTVTYKQAKPYPFVALEGHGFPIQYYGLDGHLAEQSHSTCGVWSPTPARCSRPSQPGSGRDTGSSRCRVIQGSLGRGDQGQRRDGQGGSVLNRLQHQKAGVKPTVSTRERPPHVANWRTLSLALHAESWKLDQAGSPAHPLLPPSHRESG
jgi:hypothetical protein